MTLRGGHSTVDFAPDVSTPTEIISVVGGVDKIIDAKRVLTPMALTTSAVTDTDLKLTKLIVAATDDDSNRHVLYKGAAAPFNMVMGMAARSVTRLGPLTPETFNPDHGIQLEMVYVSGAGDVPEIDIFWDFHNATAIEYGLIAALVSLAATGALTAQQDTLFSGVGLAGSPAVSAALTRAIGGG